MRDDEIKARVIVHLIGVLRGQPWPATITTFCRTTGCHNWTEASDTLKTMVSSGVIAVFRWVDGKPVRVTNAEMDGTIFHGEFGIAPTQRAVELYNSLQSQ
ncbi:MAG: hypothetical protein ABSE73_06705 [Planctomycetota bacterium]